MCKAPLPPTSPPTQATAFANIAQHWLDKYKKSNKKTQKNILDLSKSYPAIPAAPLPKAPKKLPKGYQNASNKHQKNTPKPSRTPPQKSNQQHTLIFVFILPRDSKMEPQRHPEITKNNIKSVIFSVSFPMNFDTLCYHLFSSSGVPRSSEMLLKHSACHAFRATPKIWKFSKFSEQ